MTHDIAYMSASPLMERLVTDLKQWGPLIQKAESDAYELGKRISQLDDEMKQQQCRIERDVRDEKNGDGKAAFSNEKARESEVARRLMEDPEYCDLKTKTKELSELQFKAKQTSWFMRDEYKDTRTILNARTAYMVAMSDPVCRKEMLEYAERFANQGA